MKKLNKIKLKSGMTKDEVNEKIKEYLELDDPEYKGNSYKHNWKCKCGKAFPRQWSNIRTRGSIKCENCKKGIKEEYKNIKDIYLKKDTLKEEINKIINKWIIFEDPVYKGSNITHNWKCTCGNDITPRTWSVIKSQEAYKCKDCLNLKYLDTIKFDDLPSFDKGNELDEIKLLKGMKKDQVNILISGWLKLADEKYEGCEHNHKWECKCGEPFIRQWSNIRTRGSIKCDKCKYGIKSNYSSIGEVYLPPGTNKEEINKIIDKWIKLKDNEYISSKENHNWICSCGETIKERTWNTIKRGHIYCEECSKKAKLRKQHEEKVNLIKGYTYIKSYFAGDILDDNGEEVRGQDTHIRVRHDYCKKEYDVALRVFYNKKTKENGYKCPKCCGCLENSVFYKRPDIDNMIKYDENKNMVNTKLISPYSRQKLYYECSKCKEISFKPMTLNNITNNGYTCYICSDGVSIPEKFMAAILKQLNIKFKRQETFKWSKK